MDIKDKGWLAAGVLAIVVVVLLGIMAFQAAENGNNLSNLLDRSAEDIKDQRDEIADKCRSQDPADRADCAAAMDDLVRILNNLERDFARIERNFEVQNVEVSTTTVETEAAVQ